MATALIIDNEFATWADALAWVAGNPDHRRVAQQQLSEDASPIVRGISVGEANDPFTGVTGALDNHRLAVARTYETDDHATPTLAVTALGTGAQVVLWMSPRTHHRLRVGALLTATQHQRPMRENPFKTIAGLGRHEVRRWGLDWYWYLYDLSDTTRDALLNVVPAPDSEGNARTWKDIAVARVTWRHRIVAGQNARLDLEGTVEYFTTDPMVNGEPVVGLTTAVNAKEYSGGSISELATARRSKAYQDATTVAGHGTALAGTVGGVVAVASWVVSKSTAAGYDILTAYLSLGNPQIRTAVLAAGEAAANPWLAQNIVGADGVQRTVQAEIGIELDDPPIVGGSALGWVDFPSIP